MGLPLFHCAICGFMYYIRADSFPSLCFPSSSSMSVVHASSREIVRDVPILSTPASLCLHKDARFLCVFCVSRGEFTTSRCSRVNSLCNTGCPLCLLLEGVCLLQADRVLCKTDRFVLLAVLKKETKKQRRERRQCQECLRKTRKHFRLLPCPKTHFLYLSLDVSFQNICILIISPSLTAPPIFN